MKTSLRTVFLLCLVAGTFTQGFDLLDAFDTVVPTTPKPKEQPKIPEKPKADGGLDLLDAVGGDTPTEKPKKPSSDDFGGFDLDLGDALGPDLTDPESSDKKTSGGGGGGALDDSALFDIAGGGGGGGGYKPDGGQGGHGPEPGYDPPGGADQPQEAGSGQIAGIVSAIGVALVGAASSYFAYQKKKLCFKMQGGADPERGKGHHGTYSEPQVLSNLLQTN